MPATRRQFLQSSAAALASLACFRSGRGAEGPVPVRAITRGPKYHWFGYYDKFEFDPTNRYVLSNEVDFEHRSPTGADVINVGMVDLQQNDAWIELGQSNAWGWQQGCMLQWLPGSKSDVIWNDREGDKFVARMMNVQTRQQRTLASPIYTISPDGQFAITPDFARIQRFRPGYGYAGLPDQFENDLAPADSGVFLVDLKTGERKLILSLQEIAKVPFQGDSVQNNWHWFNHLLVSPDSRRFVVLNRWRERDPATGGPNMVKGWKTRMVTANVDGSDVYVLDLPGMISHFVWRDPEHLCMWTKPADGPSGFYVVQDRTTKVELIGAGVMTVDGHNTYLPQHPDWILCDAYPDKNRNQIPYLFQLSTGRRFDLGAFYSPDPYKGEWRCDTHPRSSNDGRMVVIDSPHGGNGRQLYLLDIGSLLDS